jgi:hypothetical protein
MMGALQSMLAIVLTVLSGCLSGLIDGHMIFDDLSIAFDQEIASSQSSHLSKLKQERLILSGIVGAPVGWI